MKNILFLSFLLSFSIQVHSQKTVPFFGNINWVNGFAKEISGETISYYSAFPEYATTALLTRATDGSKTIEWETAAVPADLQGPYVYFSWVAGHSSATSGGKRNFDLYVNDEKLLTFTTMPANQMPIWSYAAADSSRLVFERTKTDGANDAHGLMYLRLPVRKVNPGKSIRLKIIGQSQNSNDWFMTFEFSFEEKVDIAPTPFILKNGMQPIALTALHFGKPETLQVEINKQSTINFIVKEGLNNFDIPVKAVQQPDSIFIKVTAGKNILANTFVRLEPVKHKTIYTLPHSHFDVGYTDIQTNIENKQVNNLLTGIAFAKKTNNYPEGSKFVWNLEGTYAADLYLKRMNPQQQKDFKVAVRKGQVAINGMFLNTLTGLCQPEELLQLFKLSTTLARETGVKIDAAMISDVPGYTWGLVTAMAQAGIKYFSPAPNYFDRIGDILQQMEERPFYWASPSGKEKVLVWIPYKGYALSSGVPHLNAKFIATYIDALKQKKFPYDISYMRWSGHGDNAVPEIEVSDFVKEWNAKYQWPKIIISSTSKAFSAFETKYGTQLPVYKGDWTGYWEDGAGSSAYETGQNRHSSSRLTQAETIWAINHPKKFPANKFKAAWQQVLLYSEHTWGADESVSTPLSKKTTEQWEIKKSYASMADTLSIQLLKEAAGSNNLQDNSHSIQVYNTHSWENSGLVLVPKSLSTIGDRVTDENGNSIVTQRLKTGELAFVAEKIPAFSARVFNIIPGRTEYSSTILANEQGLDNGILSIKIDTNTGGIKSLQHKAINNDFVDTTGNNYLNDYLYLEGDKLVDLKRNGPVQVSVKETGPVLASLLIHSAAPGCSSLNTEIRLIKGFDYVEINNVLDKKPAPLNPNPGDGSWANTGGKESLNFGFPFQVSNGDIKLDIPLAMMRPETDQIPGSCKNWLEIGKWADVSNKQFGITLASLDAPLVEIGEISARLLGGQSNPAAWRKNIAPTQTIYSWALNNHWETNYRANQEGIIPFRYALQPHQIFDPVAATQFASNLTEPFVVAAATKNKLSKSLLLLSSKNIVVLVLKPTEDGKAWIISLFNPGNKSEKTTLQWQQKIKHSYYSNTAEARLELAPPELELAPLQLLTLRVERL
jgi:hypothetical protein